MKYKTILMALVSASWKWLLRICGLLLAGLLLYVGGLVLRDNIVWLRMPARVRHYLADRFGEDAYAWVRLRRRNRADSDFRRGYAEAAAKARELDVQFYALLASEGPSLSDLEFVDHGSRREGMTPDTFPIWDPGGRGSEVRDRLRGFRLLRAHAALAAIEPSDLAWAAKSLTVPESDRLSAAWRALRKAASSRPRDRAAELAARSRLADLFYGGAASARILVAQPDPGEAAAQALSRRFRLEAPGRGEAGVRFLRTLLALLVRSEEGRWVIAGVCEEYEKAGRKITISLGDPAKETADPEATRGQADPGHPDVGGFAVPGSGLVVLSPSLMDNPRENRIPVFGASSLGHELEHLRLWQLVQSRTPYGDLLAHDFDDEKQAELVEMLVAADLAKSLPDSGSEGFRRIRVLARDPDWFWDATMTQGYFLSLDFLQCDPNDQLADIYFRRRWALEQQLEGLSSVLRKDIPDRLWWIGHLERVHGMRGLEALRRSTCREAADDADRIASLKDAIAQLKAREDWVWSADADKEFARVARATRYYPEPYAALVYDPTVDMEDALWRRLFLTPLPEGPGTPLAAPQAAPPRRPRAAAGAARSDAEPLGEEELQAAITNDRIKNHHEPPY